MFRGSVKLKDNKTRRQNNRKKIQSLQSIDKTPLSITLELQHLLLMLLVSSLLSVHKWNNWISKLKLWEKSSAKSADFQYGCTCTFIHCTCCSSLFISGNFYFSFVSTLLAYITIPKNERKPKLTESEIKKLTTTYTLSFYFKFKSIMLLPFLEMAYTEHMDSNWA